LGSISTSSYDFFFSFVKVETRMVCGARRNNATVGGKRKNRKNNVSMRKRRNNMMRRKNNVSMRRNNVSMRRNNMMRRMMYGGYDSAPAPTTGNAMAGMQAQSLAQGQQFDAMHKNQHGGGLDAGPFPGAVMMPSVLPENLHASARVAPLDAAIKEISGLKDQSGGRRRRRGSKKSKKASRKSKGRKGSRKGRKGMKGGAWSMDNAQSVSASGMLLPSGLESKALSGMNAEWKLAENPKAFAPGYSSY
jgi:hypothetical protein